MHEKTLKIEDVFKATKMPLSNIGKKIITRAFNLANEAHKTQKRADGTPYIQHCLATAKTLAKIGMDARTIAAGLMHDVPEDTAITLTAIKKDFDADIAYMIGGITKLGKIKLNNTPEDYKLENWRRMFLSMGSDIRTVIIKLADRLHNMQTLNNLPEKKRHRIANETMEIYVPIANRLGIGEIYGELVDLCFEQLDLENYEKTKALSEEKLKQHYVDKAIVEIKKFLKEQRIKFLNVHGRSKSIYSLHTKLLKYEMNMNQVFDFTAIRIIVSDIATCYEILGAVHKKYRPMIGRIKDYISLPKPNGYQSIHTTVFGPKGNVIEIQIRTQKMHDEAEFGIAAHWLYEEQEKKGWRNYFKSSNRTVNTTKKEIDWVKQLQEWQKDLGNNNQEFMEGLKVDFLKNHIFAFTPNGDIVELPEGASIVDFAYAIHTEIGDSVTGARVDGKMTSLDSVVENGQIIEILTDKNRKYPNGDWLNFVKTSNAKNSIRKAIKIAKESGEFKEI
ncbi:MAG: bifunctional (p)ppGpp synthetase/guanosine-3',5'-bis(diphosphate) 3'-pyrophosphohydrolase [Candidatus Moranbacteria bacterium]|nr:bifunctional (p)ppGpp synthetase/guanosine-3',5'-bis(diphosphate) 3'-pyrophosphohydrolase [Candidatus Moranbacteria bacterium]